MESKRFFILMVILFGIMLLIFLLSSILKTPKTAPQQKTTTTITPSIVHISNPPANEQQVIGTFQYTISYLKSKPVSTSPPYKYIMIYYTIQNSDLQPIHFNAQYFKLTDAAGTVYTPVTSDTSPDETSFDVQGNTIQTQSFEYQLSSTIHDYYYTFGNPENTQRRIISL